MVEIFSQSIFKMNKMFKCLICFSLVAITVNVAAAHDNGSPPEKVFLLSEVTAINAVAVEPFVITAVIIEAEAVLFTARSERSFVTNTLANSCWDAGYFERIRPGYQDPLKCKIIEPPSLKTITSSSGGLPCWQV